MSAFTNPRVIQTFRGWHF